MGGCDQPLGWLILGGDKPAVSVVMASDDMDIIFCQFWARVSNFGFHWIIVHSNLLFRCTPNLWLWNISLLGQCCFLMGGCLFREGRSVAELGQFCFMTLSGHVITFTTCLARARRARSDLACVPSRRVSETSSRSCEMAPSSHSCVQMAVSGLYSDDLSQGLSFLDILIHYSETSRRFAPLDCFSPPR